MTLYTLRAALSSRADLPSNSADDRRDGGSNLGKQGLVVNRYGSDHAAKAARGAVYLEFGRHGAALDQADFVDRKPWQNSARAPEARLK